MPQELRGVAGATLDTSGISRRMRDMGPNTDAILYKCIDDRWYTLQGHASDEYDNAH